MGIQRTKLYWNNYILLELLEFISNVHAEEGCILVLKGQLELLDTDQMNGSIKKKRKPPNPDIENDPKRKKERDERRERERTEAEARGDVYEDSDWEEDMTLYDAQELICTSLCNIYVL